MVYSDTLKRCAPHMAQLPFGYDALRILADADRYDEHEGESFAVAAPLYWAAMHCYAGQGDPLYAAACSLGYEPGMLEKGPEPGTSERETYDELCQLFLGCDRPRRMDK